jgi:uncharacterized membrane protein
MTEPTAEERVKMLVKFVDDNFKRRRTADIFRVFLPAILILTILIFIMVLVIYQWTNISTLAWAPGLVSVMAIVIAFTSYTTSSVQLMNRRIAHMIAERLRSRLSDKSDEAFHLLVPLVALKQENYPLTLTVLYGIDKEIFKPAKLVEYYYFK